MRITTITFLLLIMTSVVTLAQAPQAFKYQAVARNSTGEVLSDQNISLKVNIIMGSADGLTVYSEIHNVRTTNLGLVNLTIGVGENPTSVFSSLDWGAGNHYIRIEMDPTGSGKYIEMGVSQLLSVPYALYSLEAGNGGVITGGGNLWKDDKPTGNIFNTNSGNVGLGTKTPDELLHVAGSFKLEDGTQGSGKILTSDASGVASWTDPAPAFIETDPVFGISPAFGITGAEITNWNIAFLWGDHSLEGYLTSETDPVFGMSPAFGIAGSDISNWNEAYGWGDHSLEGYLTSETDPVFGMSPAFAIAGTDISNWNTALGWGDHSLAGYLTMETDPLFSMSPAFGISGSEITNWNTAFLWGDHSMAGYLMSESDPVFGMSPAFAIAGTDISNWNAAFGWGDHSLAGYLTMETDPHFSMSPAFGIAGTDVSNWNEAYSWGDHSLGGYLTSETDPVFSMSPAFGISIMDILNWNDAHNWGDHSLQGYLTSETDPVFAMSAAFGIAGTDIANWNEAHGWGDHSLEGYLAMESDPAFIMSPAFGIAGTDITEWNEAYSWGDHSLGGYLTSETDPVFSMSPAFGISIMDILNWNDAHNWGDHSLQGYLTSETDPVFGMSAAFGIAGTDINEWDDAYNWGDHSTAGYDPTPDSWSGSGDVYLMAGSVGIGTDSPDESLHTTGKVKIEGMMAGNILDSLVTWNPADSTLRVIPASSVGGGGGIGIVPDPSIPVPIAFQGDTLWVHPTDNASSIDWATATTTCDNLSAFGKDDWYTPSRVELDAIYKQSFLLTGLEQYNEWKYWSGTEKDMDDAFSQRMDYGGPDPDPKTDSDGHRVRCIRKN